MIRSYKDLDVWVKGVALVKDIYLVTREFPKEEIYGLMSQMRRSAVSIPSNIAEGKSRQTKKEYIQFLYIAKGSCAELGTQVIIANEIGYIDSKESKNIESEIDRISKMLMGLIKKLKT